MKKIKKILYVTYSFPPVAGPEVFRMINFIRNLPKFGWEPVVLTANNGFGWLYDKDLIDKVPKDIKIVRTKCINYRKILFWQRLDGGNRFHKKIDQPLGRLGLFARRILHNWVFIPDYAIGWFPFALFTGYRLIKKEKIDMIYASAPRWTNNVIALILKRITGKPFVAEFRDDWTGNPQIQFSKIKKIRRIDRFLERTIFSHADRVVGVTQAVLQKMKNRYTKVNKDKFRFIPNGYNEGDFTPSQDKLSQNDKIVFSHIGTVNADRSRTDFCKALYSLFRDYPEIKNEILFNFVGVIDDKFTYSLKKYHLSEWVNLVGFVPYKEAISYIQKSDVLLLIIGPIKTDAVSIPSKIFQYINLKKPILALAPLGCEPARIIQKAKAGVIVDPNDQEEIKQAFLELYKIWKDGSLKSEPDLEYIRKFEIKNIVKELVDLFENLLRCS